jgi:nicotinate dehydrogenase subunit A
MPVSEAQNRSITTLEGLGSMAHPHPLQKAFIDEQAAQCGYCGNGMIMNAKVLLDKNPHPTEPQIKDALQGVLCRCGVYGRITRAIRRAETHSV